MKGVGRATLAAALLLAAVLAAGRVYAASSLEAGIGMSGSLEALSPLKVPQGSVVSSDSLFIVVFNQRSYPQHVRLGYEAPPGITVTFDPNTTDLVMPPKSSKRFRVIVNVSDQVPPGTYTVYVKAYVVRRPEPGKVAVLEGAAQRLVIEVTGEYAYITVKAVDPAGNVAHAALVRLYRSIKGRLVSVADSWSGVLSAKVIPGDYLVRVYMAGEKVGERRVTLEPYDNKTVVIEAKIVYIERFSLRLVERGDTLLANMHIVVKNLYKTLRDVNIVLHVWRDGVLVDEKQLVTSSTLPKGRSEYTFDYIPPEGFTPGNYTFKILVYGYGGRLLAASQTLWAYIPASPYKTYAAALAAVAAVAAAAYLAKKRRSSPQSG